MNNTVKVLQSEVKVSTEIMAESIVKISRGVKDALEGGLTERALVILLHHQTRVSMDAIEKTLRGLKALETNYVNPKKVSK